MKMTLQAGGIQLVSNQAALRTWHERSRRVTVLVAAIIILSLADLFLTLAYLQANWMLEANPIAAWLIKSTQSPWALAAFKGLTVGICVAVLLYQRRSVASEIAAWCAVGILTIMSVMWHEYAAHFDDPADLVLAQSSSMDDGRLGLP